MGACGGEGGTSGDVTFESRYAGGVFWGIGRDGDGIAAAGAGDGDGRSSFLSPIVLHDRARETVAPPGMEMTASPRGLLR